MRNIHLEFANTTSNYSRTEFFKNWFEHRGFEYVEYQQDILSNKLGFNGNPMVLAVSPCGGKTLMSIAAIDRYLLDNPTHKVLVLTHGQTVLRSQYADDIFDAKPNFTWTTIVSTLDPDSQFPQTESKDIERSNVQVTVSLPHSIRTKTLPHFDLVVVDEAHQFYFAEMVQSVLKQVSPKHELLLTGSPSKFVARNFKNIIPVSLEILADSGRICNPIIEVAGSTYDFKLSDYNADYELKTEINIKVEDTQSSLNMVLKEICKKLGIDSNWSNALKNLSKTMVVCRGKEQATDAYNFFKDENINAALSLSGNDKDSSEIKRFKKEDDCVILIVIRRGILGFNFPALTNVIDLSCSQNVDKILQLLCRVVRKSPTGEQKFFYKVCPIALVDHFKYVMTAVLCLTNQEYFIKFNGKDFLDLPLPAMRVKDSKMNKNATERNKNGGSIRNKSTQFKPIEFSGLPAFTFFKNCLNIMNNNTLCSYVLTTLREVTKNINNKTRTERFLTTNTEERIDSCCKIYSENNCKKIEDFTKIDFRGYNWLIRNNLLTEFYQRVGLTIKAKRFANNSNEDNIKACHKIYIDNNCKKISDYSRIDASGYAWLRKNELLDDFQKRFSIQARSGRFAYLDTKQGFESCLNVFLENKFETIMAYSIGDKSGYWWLRKNGLWTKFQERVNIPNKTASRFNNLTTEQGIDLCCTIYNENPGNSFNKIDPVGYQWLSRNNLLSDFNKCLNLKGRKRHRRT